MKRTLMVVLGVVLVLVGLGFVLPALAKLKSLDAVSTCALLFVGLVLMTGGIGGAIHSLIRRRV